MAFLLDHPDIGTLTETRSDIAFCHSGAYDKVKTEFQEINLQSSN